MPTYAVTIRKQIAQTFLVEADNITEAKQLARDGDERCNAVGFDEIYPQPTPTVMSAHLDGSN